MAITAKTQKIRKQILRDVRNHPQDIVRHICELFDISRQAVNRHMQALISEDKLVSYGTTRNKTYSLGPVRENQYLFNLKDKKVDEHKVYTQHFSWLVDDLSTDIEDIIFYGFTEMVNNVIDHSEGETCTIYMDRDHKNVTIFIVDDGEGIFKRIMRLCDLPDPRQSIVELAKGKFTTDPQNHSGQGIFFTSRMFDFFVIESKGLKFTHHDGDEFDFFDEVQDRISDLGTVVFMALKLDSKRKMKEVFDQFTSGEEDDFAFNKTIIPVRLAKFDKELLVSRSQAKRLLTRIENFKYVVFDFESVEAIGQAFADEIFRVYQLRHPEIIIHYTNVEPNVESMIKRAKVS